MDNSQEHVLPERNKKVRLDHEGLMAIALNWFPKQQVRKEERAVSGKRIISLLLPVLLIFVSLMAVIHSSVMMADAKIEYQKLKSEETLLQSEIDWLLGKLTVKNDILKIEDIARNELGMVDESYLSQHYVSVLNDEGVDYYPSQGKSSVLFSLFRELQK